MLGRFICKVILLPVRYNSTTIVTIKRFGLLVHSRFYFLLKTECSHIRQGPLPINVTSGIKGTKCREQTTKLIQTDEPYCEQAATWELHLLLYGTTYSTLSTVEYLLLSDIMFSCGDFLSLFPSSKRSFHTFQKSTLSYMNRFTDFGQLNYNIYVVIRFLHQN